MNRRGFLRNIIGGVAATAAVRTWPFRVYSFPTDIQVAHDIPDFDQICAQTLAALRDEILYDNFFVDSAWLVRMKAATQLDKFHGGTMRSPFQYAP